MGVFRQFPYSNFHEMNMDWILDEIKKLQKQCTYIINNNGDSAVVNVANYTPENVLTSDNINDAVADALNVSKYIFIPEGDYQCNLVIDKDCVIYFDRNCHMHPLDGNDNGAIDAYNCSIELYGGTFTCGDDDGGKVPEWTGSYLAKHGIIRLYNCHDVNIKGVSFPYSKSGNCILLETCRNVIIENCQFHRYLECGVRLIYECRNVKVISCVFTEIKYAINRPYCYAVSMGGYALTDVFTPPDNIIMENNFVYDSEDCALDSHGCTNITIRNNKIIDTVNAITAYNDDNRVTRPAGWQMHNILIENNYCVSSKDYDPNTGFSHQFVMLGSFNEHLDTDAGYSTNYGKYDNFTNCVFRNNYLKSPSTATGGKIHLGFIGRNYIIENNIIDCMNLGSIMFGRRIINLNIKNNTILNRGTGEILLWNCSGEYYHNVGGRTNFSSSRPSQIKGVTGDYDMTRSMGLIESGDMCRDGNDAMAVCTSYGVALRPGLSMSTLTVTISGGIATTQSAHNGIVPHLAILLDSYSSYVVDVIDLTKFKVIRSNGTAIADGTYTLTYKEATLTAI